MNIAPTERSPFSHLNWFLPLLLLVLTSACGFALARHGPPGFDVALLLWFRADADSAVLAGPPGMLAVWRGVSWFGNSGPRIVVGILTVLALVQLRRWRSGLFLTAVLLGGVTLSTFIKQWVGRPRPQLVTQLDAVSSMSFPSGHALNSTLFYFAVVVMLTLARRARAARWGLYILAAGLSAATGVARVALGVHYPTDVIAGWALAGAWLWLWFAVANRYWPGALR